MQTLRDLFRPSLTDLLGLMLLFLVVVAGGHKLFGDADTATHVATGRYILEHHAIPRTDPFSAGFPGREWFAHEWLATIAFACAWTRAGWPGVVWLSALLIAAAHLLLYRYLVRSGDDALVSFVAVVAAASVASVHWLARPHLFTILLMTIAVTGIEEVIAGRRARVWLLALPPLAALWANLHGGFLVLFPILACYAAGIALTRAPNPGPVPNPAPAPNPRPAPVPRPSLGRGLLRPFVLASAAAAGAVLINPWGFRLVRHLVAFFAARGAALRQTNEFAPPTLDDRAGVTLAIFLALCLAALVLGFGALRARPGTLFAFLLTTAMALRTVRDVEIMAVFGALVLAGGLSAWLRPRLGVAMRADLETFRRREARGGGGWAAAAFLLAACLAAAGRFPPSGFDPALFPVDMVARLQAAGIRPEGPVLTPDHWGGYLILEWPAAKVWVDSRWDMRGDAFFERYSDLVLAHPGWEAILDDAGIGWVLMPPGTPLALALRRDPAWTLWAADGVTEVYARKADPAGGAGPQATKSPSSA
jgi:hypothetical protein